MVIVNTEKQEHYWMDNKFYNKYVLRIAQRLTIQNPKWDYPLLIDGYEGYGKTNFGAGFGYCVAGLTNREFNLKQIIFDPEEMVDYAIKTSNQVIMWDEAALAALAMSGNTEIQVAIIKMLMVARKKRHLFIINIPRFYRLKEAIIERCMGMVHVYAKNQTEIGRFSFYKKDKLDAMYEEWKRTRRKPNYSKFASMRGKFAEALPKIVNEEQYDMKKDMAILTIMDRLKGKVRSKIHEDYNKLKKKISLINYPILSVDDLSNKLDIPANTIYGWRKIKITDSERLLTQQKQEGEENQDAIQEKGMD